MSLPTTRVYLDDGTGTFPYDITSKCLLSDGWSFSRGRGDWQDAVTAGEMSLTLNNSDGRFTPGSTIIASPSPVKVDQRIRVKETVNGTTYNRFTGYVKAWPQSWPATVPTWSTVQITATDAQARAERRVLRSVIEEEVLLDSPTAYYTLGESAEATTAADSSGNQAPMLTMTGSGTDVVFGNATGPGTDGLTAATFAGEKYLTATLGSAVAALECYFSTTVAPGAGSAAAMLSDITANVAIFVGADGRLHTQDTSDLTSPVVTDGATHHLVWLSGHVYLDGADIGAPTAAPSGAVIGVGGGGGQHSGGAPLTSPFTGVIAHVAAYAGAPSATRALAHSQAGSTGFAGESGTARITRLAGYSGIPLGTLDTSLTNVGFSDWTGSSGGEQIAAAVEAEGGLGYVDGSGNLVFFNRDAAPEKVTPDLTLTADYVTPDVQPTTDDQQIKNYVEATASGTGVTQVVRSTTSETTHGRYTDSKTYLVQTDQEALDRANWLVTNYAEPTTRFGTLTVNLYKMAAVMQQTVVSKLEPGAYLRVTGNPSQMPGGATVDVVVQGIAAKQSGSEWSITCNVVDRDLFNTGIFDDATYGVFDSAVARFGV